MEKALIFLPNFCDGAFCSEKVNQAMVNEKVERERTSFYWVFFSPLPLYFSLSFIKCEQEKSEYKVLEMDDRANY